MRQIILMTLIFISASSFAQVIWPGTTAPCNSTLDACAEGIPRGEVIEIHTNGPINQSLTTTNGISLVAGTGFKPVFAEGHNVNISSSSPDELTVSISGLTLTKGRILYNARGLFNDTSTQLNLTNNHIIESTSAGDAIIVNNFGNHTLDINIAYNQVNFDPNGNVLERSGAIAISNALNFGLPATAVMTGRVYGNEVNVVGDQSIGIGLYELSDGSFDLDVSSNVLTGGETAAMFIGKVIGSNGSSRLDFAHNASYSNQVDDDFRGLMAEIEAGEIEINAINNTIVGAFDGFNFQESGSGQVEVDFYNNIVAFSEAPVVLNFYNLADSTIVFNNDNNLFHNNDLNDPDFVAGPNFISADPKIKGLQNGRLKPGSPAIESGNDIILFAVASVPLIDADGLFRIKNGNPGSGGVSIDVGAYEAGDIRVLDRKEVTSSNLNSIEYQAINIDEFAKLQVTQNFNPDGTNLIDGISNDANIGVYRPVSTWIIFTQDSAVIDINTAFNVWNPSPSSQNFVHTATDAISTSESFTELDRSGLNDNPGAILSVTQYWEGVFNDNPVGVFYNPFTNKWNIYNSNFVDMPLMAQFNVYYQEESNNAFIHRTSDANIINDTTLIDHPLLNNSPCAQFQITYDSGLIFENKTGVVYNQSRNQWSIFNQGGELMPESARFHVIVSAEQIAECSDVIFKDDFE